MKSEPMIVLAILLTQCTLIMSRGVVLPASTSLLSRSEAIRSRQWSYLHENKVLFSNLHEETTTSTTPKPAIKLSIKPERLIGSLRTIFNKLPTFTKKTREQRNDYIPKKFKIYEAVPTKN